MEGAGPGTGRGPRATAPRLQIRRKFDPIPKSGTSSSAELARHHQSSVCPAALAAMQEQHAERGIKRARAPLISPCGRRPSSARETHKTKLQSVDTSGAIGIARIENLLDSWCFEPRRTLKTTDFLLADCVLT